MSEEWQLLVELTKLRSIVDTLLNDLADTNGEAVAVNQDYFWSIPPAELYEVYETPAELTIGALSESWDNLRGLAEGTDDPFPYHLVWLADVLRAIGHRG